MRGLMTARAIWKASLEFDGVRVPVKLYAAVEERGVQFRLLHAKDGVPVRQRLVDRSSQEEVAPEDAQRGLELEPGLFVVMRPREIAAAAPKPSRAIEVTRFVPATVIDSSWYERPYFLGPDASAADYGALLRALGETNLCGIARWTLRGRRYFGALEARDSHLALIALRPAQEHVAAMSLPEPDKSIRAGERELAGQLVAALAGPFDPALLRDEYRERVLALVAAKSKGRPFKTRTEVMPRSAGDLQRALRQSLRATRQKRRAAA
jgi:DNA end-binding protein Ku